MTQPLFCNYGGIIQCYALHSALKRLGHETIILQREFNKKYTLRGACIYYAKHIIKLLLGIQSSWHYHVDRKKLDYIAQNTNKFIDKNINPRSKKCYSTEELQKEVNGLNLNAIIVGSDQVWRPEYSPCLPNFFLNFLGNDSKIKRISYAASFGTDKWTYSQELEKDCKVLLHKFDAISVREHSAVKLCKNHFGVDANVCIDPTLLLEKEDYLSILDKRNISRGDFFCYVLDRTQWKKDIIKRIVEITGYSTFESMPELSDTVYNIYKDIERCIYPPTEEWLSAFNEAKMILTDSFHGTVFSIIFNKPFWVIGNQGRGMTRFDTILSEFGLKDRLITPETLDSIDFNAPIDWEHINSIKKKLQKKSLLFLENSLH